MCSSCRCPATDAGLTGKAFDAREKLRSSGWWGSRACLQDLIGRKVDGDRHDIDHMSFFCDLSSFNDVKVNADDPEPPERNRRASHAARFGGRPVAASQY